MRKMIAGMLVLGAVVSGCAKNANEVSASYVSPSRFSNMSCDDLNAEVNRLAAEVSTYTKLQDEDATRDAVVTGVGAILFLPALLVLAVDDHADELSRYKGEYQAVDSARIAKGCDAKMTSEAEPKAT